MNALDDVSAVVEHPSDVLCVDGAREVGVAMMTTIAVRRGYSQKLSANKVLGADDVLVLLIIEHRVIRQIVALEFGEERLQKVSLGLDFLG